MEIAGLDKNKDTVLEIGAGFGFLTQFLAIHSKRVISMELDADLALLAERRMIDHDNVEIYNVDFLKTDLSVFEFDKIVANPPYKISSEILFKILEEKPVESTLTFQKEFVQHVEARPGDRDYSRLSVMVAFHAEVEKGRVFSPHSFYPAPKVDSQVIKLVPHQGNLFASLEQRDAFRIFLKAVFNRKHRKISVNLVSYLKSQGISKQEARMILNEFLGIPRMSNRAANLSPDQLYGLFQQVHPILELGQ